MYHGEYLLVYPPSDGLPAFRLLGGRQVKYADPQQNLIKSPFNKLKVIFFTFWRAPHEMIFLKANSVYFSMRFRSLR